MRLRLGAVLFAVCFCALASDSVNSVVTTVRNGLHKKHKDADIAFAIEKSELTDRLEDRVIEILESEGAGPQTLGVLQHLRDESRSLPVPAEPPAGMEPPSPPSSVEEHQAWQATRAKALEYTRTLPDFICAETVHRWADPNGHEEWQPYSTVVTDLSYFDRQEHYRLITVDGKPSDKPLLAVGGAMSQGEFGSLLSIIFNPGSQTDYRWDHWTMLRKRPTYVFFCRIAASHAPHRLTYGENPETAVTVAAGLRAYVYIDRETNAVTRISQEAEDIPESFPVQRSSSVLDYDYVDIGGQKYLLPLRAEVRIDVGKAQRLNAVEFQNYRKFGADTTVTFSDPKVVKK